ncbi:MAG: N-6 DNA methylase [Saprospiraceae bacterium]
MNNRLKQLLKKLELSEERGVILLSNVKTWYNIDLFSFDIREQLNNINPSAIYHFNNQPFILFFDKTDESNSLKEDTQIFKEVWSWDVVPIIFILSSDGDKIFNAFNYQRNQSQLQEILLSENEKNELFSFWNLQSGTTWKILEEKFYKKGKRNILNKQRVNHKLFANIKDAREKLEAFFPYPEFINILILRLIFIRYLIDREVEIDDNYIKGNDKETCRKSFNKLIGSGKKLLSFFEYLEQRFNGNLFETKDDLTIPSKVFEMLQAFFSDEFTESKKSLFYFDVFDFGVIPVEVISGIYESVIDEKKRKEDSAVYTPLFLVDYILNRTVEKHLDKKQSLCKVLDPSCGSGIFLTQTYRRLVEHEKQKGIELTDDKLKSIAQKYIFGIDRDANALNVAAFSIYISILDHKQPKEINNFKLPNLIGNNLFKNDFFNDDDTIETIGEKIVHPFNSRLKTENLDFIIGNPPWGRKNHKITDKFHLKYAEKMGNRLSNFEISQSFLMRVEDFSNPNTQCSMIVSSRAFYNRTQEFKDYFFSNFLVESILDLSAARRMVFQGATSPCIVLIYQYAFFQSTEQNLVEHIAIKPNRLLKNYKVITIGVDDKKSLLQKYFKEYNWFFKVALYGNFFDFKLLDRIIRVTTVGNLIEKTNTIKKGKGFLKGTPKEYFAFLEGLPKIEAKQVSNFYTSSNKNYYILKKKDTYLESGRKLMLFKGHHIILKKRTEKETQLVISFMENDIAFNDTMYGVSSEKSIVLLKQIFGLLISNVNTYFQYLTSSNWGVSTRPEITLEEYLSFPYLEVSNQENFINHVDDFINVYKNYYESLLKSSIPPNPNNLSSFKAINEIVNKTYQISEVEEDLIDYTLNVARYEFQESKLHKFLRKPTIDELKEYADVFYEYYGNVYNEYGEYFQIEIYQLNHFTAMKFSIVDASPNEKDKIIFIKENVTEKQLFKTLATNLSLYQLTSDIFVQKKVKGYEDDFFYIIKPNEYKSWHRAMAHHDLATFKSEMMQTEQELMIETYE